MRRRTKDTRRRSRGGFTLIELMAVLLILAIMAGFGVPMVMSRIEKARQTEAITQTKQLVNAVRQFNMDTGRYPTEQEGLESLLVRPADVQGWDGPYIQDWTRIPKDPWGQAYIYTLPLSETGRENPQVVSLGKGGQPGGQDLAADIINGEIDQTDAGAEGG